MIGIGSSLYLLSGVTYDGELKTILLVGATMGLLIFFVRPILSLFTLPIRIITLNLFSIVIMVFLVWVLDALFADTIFNIEPGIKNLFFTTLIVWGTEKITTLAFK